MTKVLDNFHSQPMMVVAPWADYANPTLELLIEEKNISTSYYSNSLILYSYFLFLTCKYPTDIADYCKQNIF